MSPVWAKQNALEAGYQIFFGPCLVNEGRMIDSVMDEALAQKRDVVIVEGDPTRKQRRFWVYKRKEGRRHD